MFIEDGLENNWIHVVEYLGSFVKLQVVGQEFDVLG